MWKIYTKIFVPHYKPSYWIIRSWISIFFFLYIFIFREVDFSPSSWKFFFFLFFFWGKWNLFCDCEHSWNTEALFSIFFILVLCRHFVSRHWFLFPIHPASNTRCVLSISFSFSFFGGKFFKCESIKRKYKMHFVIVDVKWTVKKIRRREIREKIKEINCRVNNKNEKTTNVVRSLSFVCIKFIFKLTFCVSLDLTWFSGIFSGEKKIWNFWFFQIKFLIFLKTVENFLKIIPILIY